jgi:hypothetical protein
MQSYSMPVLHCPVWNFPQQVVTSHQVIGWYYSNTIKLPNKMDYIPSSIEAIFDEMYRIEAVGWISIFNTYGCRHSFT